MKLDEANIKGLIYNAEVSSLGTHFSSTFKSSVKPVKNNSSGIVGIHILSADLLNRCAFCSGLKRKVSFLGPLYAFIPSKIDCP